MPTARDIALIFLAIEAFFVALIPMVVLAGLAYGVYWLRGKVVEYLHLGQLYAQKLHDAVEKYSRSVTTPFIRVHTTTRMATTILNNLVTRRQL